MQIFKSTSFYLREQSSSQIEECTTFFPRLMYTIEELKRNKVIQVFSNGILPEAIVERQKLAREEKLFGKISENKERLTELKEKRRLEAAMTQIRSTVNTRKELIKFAKRHKSTRNW